MWVLIILYRGRLSRHGYYGEIYEATTASFLGHCVQYSFILHQHPFAIRIVFLHRSGNLGSFFAKISLKNLDRPD